MTEKQKYFDSLRSRKAQLGLCCCFIRKKNGNYMHLKSTSMVISG